MLTAIYFVLAAFMAYQTVQWRAWCPVELRLIAALIAFGCGGLGVAYA